VTTLAFAPTDSPSDLAKLLMDVVFDWTLGGLPARLSIPIDVRGESLILLMIAVIKPAAVSSMDLKDFSADPRIFRLIVNGTGAIVASDVLRDRRIPAEQGKQDND